VREEESMSKAAEHVGVESVESAPKVKARSGGEKDTRSDNEAAEVKLREIADELDMGMAVITRGWRKQAAYELRGIADVVGGK
jgi:hypothetical protein